MHPQSYYAHTEMAHTHYPQDNMGVWGEGLGLGWHTHTHLPPLQLRQGPLPLNLHGAFHRQPGLSIFLQEATAPGVERRGGTIDRPG